MRAQLPVFSACCLASLLCGACLERVPPAPAAAPAPAPVPVAGIVRVQVDPAQRAQAQPKGPSAAELAVLAALDEARPRATSCYQAALVRDPYVYGEVLVRIALDPAGRVEDASAVLDTVGDRELVACVERLTQALRYPAPAGSGLQLRYPFLFSSDLTPPEVVRAMMAQHGLLQEDALEADMEAPERAPAPGTLETW